MNYVIFYIISNLTLSVNCLSRFRDFIVTLPIFVCCSLCTGFPAPISIVADVLTSTAHQPVVSVAGIRSVHLQSLQRLAARRLRNHASPTHLASMLAGAISVLRGPQPDIDNLVDYDDE